MEYLSFFSEDLKLKSDTVAGNVFRGDVEHPAAGQAGFSCLPDSQVHGFLIDQTIGGVFKKGLEFLDKTVQPGIGLLVPL